MRLVLPLLCAYSVAWAGCPADSQAWSAPGQCAQAYREGEVWHTECYYSARSATKDEEGLYNRDQWINERQPGQPFFLPYEDPEVRIITAWVGQQGPHGGIDYARVDGQPFNVLAAAGGWVVWVGKDPQAGHVVILDHGGLRSLYHLHEGGMDVRRGEWVDARQQIGRATGYLHFGVAAPGQRVERLSRVFGEVPFLTRWTLLDPYGIYGGQRSLACYNNDDGVRFELQHVSFFAPAAPDFIDLDVERFSAAYRYYTRFKWHPWTVSLAATASGWTVSGSFHQETELAPSVTLFRTRQELENDILNHNEAGYQPGQISAAVDSADNARFSALFWIARPHITKQRMPPDDFLFDFEQQIKEERVLTQYLPTVIDDKLYFTATWTKLDPFRDQAMFYGLTEQEFRSKDSELAALDFDLVDILRYKDPEDGQRIAGLWHKHVEGSDFRHSIGVDAGAFEEAVIRAKSAGYGLWRLHRHSSGVDLIFLAGIAPKRPEAPTAKALQFNPADLNLVRHERVFGDDAAAEAPSIATRTEILEGEQLIDRVYPSEGQVVPADMSPFQGRFWSNDGSLLWVKAQPGAQMTVSIEAPRDGRYKLSMRYTKGSNFGVFRHIWNGRALGPEIDAYATEVQPSELVQLGIVNLQRGANDIVIELRGKNAAATDSALGIDYYELIKLD